ncbi:SpaA isopeptide-forming pilin-related protein [Bifidobacterium phasiani]|uniref:Isopeptide-forming domain-containing fimbrial protein n=1 Tax=Bifidobacterium phasiani TaxID=2834431 RepID=A0ABS6W6L3_9BIFI|nr:SpaA isopeptide-forming pilin-related protein [Bifidobacterium phasiani]MBW3082131.1 isopeptide-forming domain-containing fimbrial protein [Bifidobacterium phasiani]
MLKRCLAGVAAAALAVTGMAAMSGAANAAPVASADITLTGDAAGRTFDAYKIGDYADVNYDAENGGGLLSVGVSTDPDWSEILEDAIGAVTSTLDPTYEESEYQGNPAGFIANLDTAADGAALRQIVEYIEDQINDPDVDTPDADIPQVQGTADGVTIPVKDDGLYLVIDSNGTPILVGSPVQVATEGANQYENEIGATSSKMPLGAADLKPLTGPSTDKTVEEAEDETVIKFDDQSAYVGQTLQYTVSTKVPNTTGFGGDGNPYVLYIQDDPSSSLTLQNDYKVVIKGAGQEGTDLTVNPWDGNSEEPDLYYRIVTPQVNDGDPVTIMISDLAGFDGMPIEVTYTAKVNENALKDAVNNVAGASHDNKNWGTTGSTTVRTYGFDFTKTNKTGDKNLQGAEFIISRTDVIDDNKYLIYDTVNDTWTTGTEDQAKASPVVSDSNGQVSFQGLPLGTYTVKEVKAPTDYITPSNMTLTVTLTDENEDGVVEVQIKGGDGYLSGNQEDGYKVYNAASLAELPITGAAGITMFVVLGLLIAGAGVTVYMKSRGVRNAMRA